MSNTYQIYLISDSTGETLDRIFLALKAQFKNIEYKWCGSKWEDEYLNTYLVKLINYDEYLYINIKSENDLKLEDIFEDIGF